MLDIYPLAAKGSSIVKRVPLPLLPPMRNRPPRSEARSRIPTNPRPPRRRIARAGRPP